jgi:ABC-type transport system involved in multi-copper enzyme maturation permease subunit
MSFDRIYNLATVTFKELRRSRILFLVLFFAFVVVVLSAFFGAVAIGDQIKIIKDFGLFCISIFASLFCVISGASLLEKELSRKTIYNILGKAVHRYEFILGKFFGMAAVAVVLVIAMGISLTGYVALFDGKVSLPLIQAIYFVMLEVVFVAAAAIFFSSLVVTPLLNGLFTISLFLAGRSASYVLQLAENLQIPAIKGLYWILPHLDMLYVANTAVYEILQPFSFMVSATLYIILYATTLLALSVLSFESRQLN